MRKGKVLLTSLEKRHIKAEVQGLVLTHLDTMYWPSEKYTKGDLLAYYEKVALYMLPYLKDRPIILHRMPEGVEGKGFYQKNISFSHPDWIETFPVKHKGKIDHYLLINDKRSLLYAVNLGSIDLHPFHSRITNLDKPDYCVIDLDPHDIGFEKVIEVALFIHEILTGAKIKHFCKTSGGYGLHILIPLGAKYDYDQSRRFAETICGIVHKQLPETTSMERSPEKRPKKIYLDCLQNRTGQSIAAPYAVRPHPKATVSTPLFWDEINQKLILSEYTIETVPDRLKNIGDIFQFVLQAGIDMNKDVARLIALFS